MRSYVLLLTLLLILGGCSTVPEQTFNLEQQNLQSIAIAPTQYADDLLLRYRKDQLETVDIISPLPVGKLFAYVSKKKREANFTENSTSSTSVFANSLNTQLGNRLQKDGFKTRAATLPRESNLEHNRTGFLKEIPSSAFSGADALLETAGSVGFTAAGRGRPFEPSLWVSVRLTAANGDVLLQDRVLYNPPETDAKGLLVHATGDYLFEDQEDILENAKTADALEQATKLVIEELSFLLKGPIRDVR